MAAPVTSAPTSTPPTAPPSAVQRAREAALLDWCWAQDSLLIGFSGGVDSTYLAVIAREAMGRERMLAVIGRSASYPASQWASARGVAARFDVPVLEVDTDELSDPRYTANPTNRCYFCKTELWTRLAPVAAARGCTTIADGTNADDVGDHRPGRQAAEELGIQSPLATLGFTKADIRTLSRARGLPTWAQPASPCLSSRLPYGTAVTLERLATIDRAESALRLLGLSGDLRVRYFGERARVELSPRELEHWSAPMRRGQLEAAVRDAGFADVELSPFRSGALNVLAGIPGAP